MDNPIKFGTDGWRGIIAQDFTFDNVRACAQGVANYVNQAKLADRGVLIGYDNRFASEDFAAACAEVLAANGIRVFLCAKTAPTPVVSFGVLAKKAGGAIIITASHNPAKYNGFKYKNELGYSAPPEITAELEKNIASILAAGKVARVPLKEATSKGLVEYVDLAPVYNEQVARLVNLEEMRQSGMRVTVDSMYGAGAGYFDALLMGGCAGTLKLTELNGTRNPLFPGMHNPEPIALNLTRLSATVKRLKASVGLATDGDADRIGVIDEKGTFMTQLQVFALLAYYLLEVRGERGAIIKTITTTSMLDRLGELYKVPVLETPVGFKYVAPKMRAENALIGGEESGGYGFRGHVLERDGILAGLYFLDLMLKTGKAPSQLLEHLYNIVGPHYYERRDIAFTETERQSIAARLRQDPPSSINGIKVTRFETTDGFRYILADRSWLLIRFSGTEPLMRIYAESSSLDRVEKLLDSGKQLAGV